MHSGTGPSRTRTSQGSTFKVVTVAGALEEQLVGPQTSFRLQYSIQVADRVIHDAEERGTEDMTVSQILSRSSNVGAITLAIQLGRERLARWIERFGFGAKTGIDFPGESEGIVLPADRWTGSTIGNVPIGQGIAVTPIQMAAAYATIANGGRWIRPHVIERIGDRRIDPGDRHRVMSRQTADLLTAMMRDVVADGTGVEAQVPGYSVAGKTGTAAKPDPSGGYSDTRYVASFVGFAPAAAPRIVVLVAVDEPMGAIWGGTVAAPLFSRIAEFALPYLDVQPDVPTRSRRCRLSRPRRKEAFGDTGHEIAAKGGQVRRGPPPTPHPSGWGPSGPWRERSGETHACACLFETKDVQKSNFSPALHKGGAGGRC